MEEEDGTSALAAIIKAFAFMVIPLDIDFASTYAASWITAKLVETTAYYLLIYEFIKENAFFKCI